MSKPTTVTTLCSFFLATMALVGCDSDLTDAELGAGILADDLDLDDDAPAESRGSALTRIGARFHVLDVADLAASSEAIDPEAARELVAGADGLGLNLGAVDSAAIAGWKPLADAALELGVPVIVEDIDDSAKLAALIGVGVEADVAMITSLGLNRYHVRVYGGEELGEVEFESNDDDEVPVAEWSADTITLAVDEIGEALRSGASQAFTLETPVSMAVPQNGYRYYDFDMAEITFTPVDGQTVSLSMDFEAELVLDADRGKKNVFMRPIGSGQHPGTLASDSNTNRGYYQESQQISIWPNSTDVDLYAHAPSTANNNTTYTSSTGWTIGVEGQNPVVSFSSSNQTTTTLDDFSMVNNTSGTKASWRFAMTTDWTDMYKTPAFQKCKVKSLPDLAKSNLNPEYEVLYRADDDFTSDVTFNFKKTTVVRRISRGGDAFVCKKYSSEYSLPESRTVTINFGSI